MTHPNEAILDEIYTCWSTKDVDRALTCFTPDARYEDWAFNVVHEGHAGIREFMESVFETQKDFRVRYVQRFANDTRGSGHWIINTVWAGEWGGVDKTGTPIEFTGISLYEFEDGKVSRTVDCWDSVQLMRQFNVLTDELRVMK